MEYIFIGLLSILLGVSIYKNVILGITILRMEDALEECLDVIDEKYKSMNEILQRPLFFDSNEVKSVVNDIRAVKDSLHGIALILSKKPIENDEPEA